MTLNYNDKYVTPDYEVYYAKNSDPTKYSRYVDGELSEAYFHTVEQLDHAYEGYTLIKNKLTELGWLAHMEFVQLGRTMHLKFPVAKTVGEEILTTIGVQHNELAQKVNSYNPSHYEDYSQYYQIDHSKSINATLAVYHLQDAVSSNTPWSLMPYLRSLKPELNRHKNKLTAEETVKFLDNLNTKLIADLKEHDVPVNSVNIVALFQAHQLASRYLLLGKIVHASDYSVDTEWLLSDGFYTYLQAGVALEDALRYNSMMFKQTGPVPLESYEDAKTVPIRWYIAMHTPVNPEPAEVFF